VSFGQYLQGLREQAVLSFRAAGRALGASGVYLAAFERGERDGPPSVELIRRIAVVFERDIREVMAAAGLACDPNIVADMGRVDLDVRFRRAMLHPELVPEGLTERELGYFPPILKSKILEWGDNIFVMTRANEDFDFDEVVHGEDPEDNE